MAAPLTGKFFLKSTSRESLHNRFSEIVKSQEANSNTRGAGSLRNEIWSNSTNPIRLVRKRKPQQESAVGLRITNSVWTRTGWKRLTRYLSKRKQAGFWSFKKKYRWRVQCVNKKCRRHFRQRIRLTGWRYFKTDLKYGGTQQQVQQHDTSRRAPVPTRKELDDQLDEYMSKSKSRLDKELEDYMSLSRRRLDAELDEYMMMAEDP